MTQIKKLKKRTKYLFTSLFALVLSFTAGGVKSFIDSGSVLDGLTNIAQADSPHATSGDTSSGDGAGGDCSDDGAGCGGGCAGAGDAGCL